MKKSVLKKSALLLFVVACGGKMPETRYYQLAAPAAHAKAPPIDAVVVVEPLDTDAAYDDERIVYRQSAYRLDYYQYHRWITAPGTMVSDYLATALAHSGRFRSIDREPTDDAAVVLGGRVIAIEEIDRSAHQWDGRIALALTLTDARTGEVVWSQQVEEIEPLAAQTPEGLAAALSRAMDRVIARITPALGAHAAEQALSHAPKVPMANRAPHGRGHF